MIIAIACVSDNWGIGKNNALLFNLKQDMKFFKATTKNSIVVCGRKTLESFPKSQPLTGRSTICLCSSEKTRTDCFCVHDFETLLSLVLELGKTQDVYIIGGGQLYKEFLPYYDKIYITRVYEKVTDAEIYFPNLDINNNFFIADSSKIYEESGYNFQFLTYKNKKFLNI